MYAKALLTDLYQLTMANGYWKQRMHEREAVFYLHYRTNPYKGKYAIACGLETAIDFLDKWHFTEEDLAYLQTLESHDGKPLFEPDFLDYLSQLRFTCDVDAIPEGTVIFPHEPLIRIKGPLLQAQIIESPLLNIINFQTLIATKASRVCDAANGDSVIEFGLRRAQGIDGAMAASRAAYIGGCDSTSNTLAGQKYDIPVRGTHAHSWVTAFNNESEAFSAYADAMPHNCILLVDTFDSIRGIKHAIEVGKQLRAQGNKLFGIRLDSGDMAKISIKARAMLDDAGFQNTKIVASNNLDEYEILALKQKGAKIDVWGVGTHLVTSYDQPAIDGVYKLSALKNEAGEWQYKLKLSEETLKISNPGTLQVKRFSEPSAFVTDVIYDENIGIQATVNNAESEDLLQPVIKHGENVYDQPNIHEIQKRTKDQLKKFENRLGHYSVQVEERLLDIKQSLIKEVKSLV